MKSVSSRLTNIKNPGLEKKSKKMHHLSIVRRIGLFGNNTKGADIIRATKLNDLLEAYKLVYSIFLEKGYIQTGKEEIRIRKYEVSQYITTFIGKKQNSIVGVMSMIADSEELGLPSDKIYRHEINKLRKRSKLICEITNEAILKEYRSSAISTEMMRCIFAKLFYIQSDKIILSVNKTHKSFYELFGMRQIGQLKSYSNKFYDPVILMCWDIDELFGRWIDAEQDTIENFWMDFWFKTNPYFEQAKKWEMNINELNINIILLRGLYCKTEESPNNLKKISLV